MFVLAGKGAGCGESFTYCVYPNEPSRESEIGSDEGYNLGRREYLFTKSQEGFGQMNTIPVRVDRATDS